MRKYSFRKGWKQLPEGKQKDFKKELVTRLDISESTFYPRLRGEVEPKISEYHIIENLFLEYNVKEIWGE